jgi:hypothetical protein
MECLMEQYLRIRYATSEHRFLRLSIGGRGDGESTDPERVEAITTLFGLSTFRGMKIKVGRDED